MTRQDSYYESDRTSNTSRMSRTNDRTGRTGIRIAVIGQKGPLFVFEDEKDNRYYDWSVQPRQNRKISAQGQHRIARTGYPGQDGQQETGRTARDRTDTHSKGQDRQQGTGQGLKGRLSKMPSRTTL
jgi:hypothetical protein